MLPFLAERWVTLFLKSGNCFFVQLKAANTLILTAQNKEKKTFYRPIDNIEEIIIQSESYYSYA